MIASQNARLSQRCCWRLPRTTRSFVTAFLPLLRGDAAAGVTLQEHWTDDGRRQRADLYQTFRRERDGKNVGRQTCLAGSFAAIANPACGWLPAMACCFAAVAWRKTGTVALPARAARRHWSGPSASLFGGVIFKALIQRDAVDTIRTGLALDVNSFVAGQ